MKADEILVLWEIPLSDSPDDASEKEKPSARFYRAGDKKT